MSGLRGLALLLLLQALGEAITRALALPFPGPVVGMVLLLGALGWAPLRAPIAAAAELLLAHLSLLFVPVGVGVVPLEVGRRGAAGADVELIPIDDAWAERSFAICFRELESLPPASQRLVEYLQRRAADAEATT